MRKRVIHLDLFGHELSDVGPHISIHLDGSKIDELEVRGHLSWSKDCYLSDGNHLLEITLHNEDNDRFFDWGEDPNGKIRYLTITGMRFANDGENAVRFDLSEDDLEDGTLLFIPDVDLGLTILGEGIEIYKNNTAKIIIPARDGYVQ